jgi:hypothetical protein
VPAPHYDDVKDSLFQAFLLERAICVPALRESKRVNTRKGLCDLRVVLLLRGLYDQQLDKIGAALGARKFRRVDLAFGTFHYWARGISPVNPQLLIPAVRTADIR